jgi:hypothetical protein
VISATIHEASRAVLDDPPAHDVKTIDLLGRRDKIDRGPQVLWVWHPPGWVIEPHFHRVDQFQVVVQGDATIGKHPMPLGSVQYVDGYTPYGPVRCGSSGMTFVFLRARADIGALYMPASRQEMVRKAGRNLMPACGLKLGDWPGTLQINSLIEPHADGLAAYEIAARPGATLLPNRTALGGGMFYLILEGTLCLEGSELPSESCVFMAAGDTLRSASAGKSGARLLELQLPLS